MDIHDSKTAEAPAESVTFIHRKGLYPLLLRNLLLNVVTLTFYRFWARTAVRRFYWSSVAFAGEPLEYAGRGLDLFIGFLIALAILAPLGFAFSTVDNMLAGNGIAHVVVQSIYTIVLCALMLVARYRARRYRLSRTAWRGIRFAVDGSTARYVILSLAWWLATLATAGVATPWRRAAQRAYLTRTTTFGDRRFAFAARPSPLLLHWLWVLVLLLGPIALVLALNASTFAEAAARLAMPTPQNWIGPPLRGAGLLLISPTLGFGAYVFYRVAELRMFTAATTLDDIGFRSTMGAWGVALLLMVGGFVAVVLAIALFLGIFPLLPRLLASGLPIPIVLYGALVGGFALWAALMHLIGNGWLRRTIVATYFASVTVENAHRLDAIGQSTRPAPTRGEGLADSFEFGAT